VARFELNPVAVQEFRRDESGSQQAEHYAVFCINGNANCTLRNMIVFTNKLQPA